MKIYDFDFSEKGTHECCCNHEKAHCCYNNQEEKQCDDNISAYDNLSAYDELFKFWDIIEHNKKAMVEGAKSALKRFESEVKLDSRAMGYILGVTCDDYDKFFEDKCEPYVTMQIIAASRTIDATTMFGMQSADHEAVDNVVKLAKRTYMPLPDTLVDSDELLSVVDNDKVGLCCDKSGSVDVLDFKANEETVKKLVDIVNKMLGGEDESTQG